MFDYGKSMKIFMAQYLLCLVLHICYAAFTADATDVLYVSVVSAVCLLVSGFVAFSVRKMLYSFIAIDILSIASIFMIGLRIDTLFYSYVVFSIMILMFSIYSDCKLVSYASYSYIGAALGAIVFCREELLKNVPNFGFVYIYVIIYIILCFDLYEIVYHCTKVKKKLQESNKNAGIASATKMNFISNMSHEIRTPMNAICGMAELILHEDLPDNVRNYAQDIKKSGRVLLNEINDILDYEKIEMNKMQFSEVDYSLKKVISDSVEMAELKLSDKPVKILTNYDTNVPQLLKGDEMRMRQVVNTLLSNACKYTDNGFITIDIKAVEQTEQSVKISIVVSDSGIGISKEELADIFTSFDTFDSKKIRSYDGNALSLIVSKKIIELMGGTIVGESSVGVGSRFTVELVQAISDSEDLYSMIAFNKEDDSKKVFVPDAKVMIVDDNAVNLTVAKGIMKTFGIEATTCKSAIECINLLQNNTEFDMIFVDYMMPEYDGIDTLNMIREMDDEHIKCVPVIALTANVSEGTREQFIKEGFNDYVPKPIDVVWLNKVLERFLVNK